MYNAPGGGRRFKKVKYYFYTLCVECNNIISLLCINCACMRNRIVVLKNRSGCGCIKVVCY